MLMRAGVILKDLNGSLLRKGGVRKNLLYFVNNIHFLQGILIERTPYKDSVYIWLVVCPLFRPIDLVSLNYSKRILGGGLVTGSPREISNKTLSYLHNSDDEIISSLNTPVEIHSFLEARLKVSNWRNNPIIPEIYDFGVMFAAAGQISNAVDCLNKCYARLDDVGNQKMKIAVEILLKTLKYSEHNIMTVIRRIEEESIVRLGLVTDLRV